MSSFEDMLTGGHPNSLGKTVEVVNIILKDKVKLQELYDCYSSDDEVVRLRVSNAFKRVCKEKPDWVMEYMDRFLGEVSKIDQASAQWTIAQLIMLLEDKLSPTQKSKAQEVLKHNLAHNDDWIVLNFTSEALTNWAQDDPALVKWLKPHLQKLAKDKRKSVAKRAAKYLDQLA